jgi:hypothetical protein
MNPDPNQPQDQNAAPVEPAPIMPEVPSVEPTPIVPIEPTTPEAPAAAVAEPAQYAAAPVTEAAANPAATPITPSAEPVAQQPPVVSNPFAAAQDAPVAPVAVVNPVTPVITPPIIPVAPAPGKSKKKLAILLSSIIGGLIVLGGVAFAVYAMFFMVTKADYEAARDQLIVVKDISPEADTIISDTASVDKETALAKLDKFKAEYAKLADLKALTQDKDLKVKYDAYTAKADAYVAFAEVGIPSGYEFNDAQEVGVAALTSFKSASLIAAIDALNNAKVTDPIMKKYADAQLALYEELLQYIKIYESSTSTTSEKLSAIDDISKALNGFSSKTKTYNDEIKTKAEEVDASKALDELSKAITAKLNDL